MRTLAALAALAVAPATAAAAGFPMPGMDTTQTGATAPGNPYRFVAFPGRGNSTLLVKINRDDGRPQRHRVIAGAQTVAPVAQDGSTTGLSADGSTLVLASVRHRFPQRVSHLVLVTTANLAPERRITLRGDFSLDGVAPDGQRLYLTRYGGNDPLNYAVRVYDVAHRRLLPKPLVDPRNPTEKMVGFPVTRALSPDGRWAYTLYGGGQEQFVHALDLTGGRAFCIDLEGLSFDDVSSMHLRAQGGRIDLLNQAGGTVRRINASTFAVTTPKQHPIDLGPAAHDDAAPSDGFPWGLAAAVAAVGAGALVLLRRRYAAGTDSATSRSDSSSSPTVP